MKFGDIANDEVRRWFEDPAAPQEVNGTVKVAIPIDVRFSQALCARKDDGALPEEFGWLCLIDREAAEIYDLNHTWGREALCMDYDTWLAAVEASRGDEVFGAFEEAVAAQAAPASQATSPRAWPQTASGGRSPRRSTNGHAR